MAKKTKAASSKRATIVKKAKAEKQSKSTTKKVMQPLKKLSKAQSDRIDKVFGEYQNAHIARKITNHYPELRTWQVAHNLRLLRDKKVYDEQMLICIENTFAAELEAAQS